MLQLGSETFQLACVKVSLFCYSYRNVAISPSPMDPYLPFWGYCLYTSENPDTLNNTKSVWLNLPYMHNCSYKMFYFAVLVLLDLAEAQYTPKMADKLILLLSSLPVSD